MKRLAKLAVPAIVLTAILGGAANAESSLILDQIGDGSNIWFDLEAGGDTTIRSYGDDQRLDIDLYGTGDFDVLALGDGVTGSVIGRGSDGARITLGMCPEGMRNETIRNGPHSSGLRIPRCVW